MVNFLTHLSKVFSVIYPKNASGERQMSWMKLKKKKNKINRMKDTMKYYVSLEPTKNDNTEYEKIKKIHKKIMRKEINNIDEEFTRHILVGNIRKIDEEANTKYKTIGRLI